MSRHRPPTLLIVDDDPALRQLLSWTFEDLGYWVWAARDCQEALASAGAIAFDFALLDFHLPDGTGDHLAHALSQRIPRLQLVIMSADGDTAKASATWAWVEKPLSVNRIHRWFRRRDRWQPRRSVALNC